jgi:hypothetical protein
MLSALSAALSVTSVRYLHPMVDTIDAKRRTLPGVAQAFELETISRRISRVKILMDSLNALTLVVRSGILFVL